MYYVLFDTGNEAFFSHIADTFCSIVVHSIIDLCKNREFSPLGNTIDHKNIIEHLKKNGQPLLFLNCSLFFDVQCKNQECMTGHTVVLTSNQLNKFEFLMYKNVNVYLRAEIQNKKDQINFQRIFQSYTVANMQRLEVIHCEDKRVHDENLYLKKINKLNNKPNIQGFVYVRSAGVSDYNYFKANTTVSAVTVCDCFQEKLAHFVKGDV
jgi:hypothetical protein